MQKSENNRFFSFALDSANVKFNVWNGPEMVHHLLKWWIYVDTLAKNSVYFSITNMWSWIKIYWQKVKLLVLVDLTREKSFEREIINFQ